jgi:hypothetical protein
MSYAKAEAHIPKPLIKAAVQLDLLEVGKEYTSSITIRAGKKRVRSFEVLACYPDFYSIKDLTNGRTETLRKSDIHCGIIKIEGLNIKEKVLEAVEELKEAEKVKMTKEIMKKLVIEGFEWIMNNPGKPYFTNDRLSEALNYPQKKKVLDEIWEKLVYEGYEGSVETVRGKRGAVGLVYKIPKAAIEPKDCECEIETTKATDVSNHLGTIKGVDPEPVRIEDAKPEPIMATLESTKEILRIDGIRYMDLETLNNIKATHQLLKLTGKPIALDIVFREVANE